MGWLHISINKGISSPTGTSAGNSTSSLRCVPWTVTRRVCCIQRDPSTCYDGAHAHHHNKSPGSELATEAFKLSRQLRIQIGQSAGTAFEARGDCFEIRDNLSRISIPLGH